MRKIILLLLAVLAVACQKTGITRSKENFGNGWQFKKQDAAWQDINLPHTAQIEPLVVVNQWQGNSFYKKEFDLTPAENEKLFLYFEGVMHEADVTVNAKKAAHHEGGYTPFTVDITDLVTKGKNTVEVKVNNESNPEIPPGKPLSTLDFNYYGGIYRNAYLIRTGKLYITDAVHANVTAGGGVFVHFDEISKNKAEGTIKVHLKNEFDKEKEVTARITLKDASGKEEVFESDKIKVQPGSAAELTQQIAVAKPKLWSVTNPELYEVNVRLVSGNEELDNYTVKTGIRKIEIKDDGFYLNDEKLFINGTNRHQEYPYIGYALSDEAQYRDAVKIKNAGYDFVRLSHYPHSESFLSACDELGILVMDCISGWQFFGNEKFVQNSYQEIKDMARRDRNHPSVIFWEVSLNESEMTETYMKKANEILRAELPFKNTYTAGWMDNENYYLFIPARQHGKAPDYWNNYNKGSRKIFIAEYGDWEYYAQNAGFNQTEFANLKEDERTSRQLRGSGEKRLLQQALNFQEAYNSNLKGANTIGHANWLIFDYNRGYSPDIESSGISDIFRLPKFAHYFYQSQRAPQQDLKEPLQSGPMVYIASYWDENSSPNVKVFSNCDEVALYLDGELIAKQKPQRNAFSDALQYPPFEFSLPAYKAGTLKAEGFVKGEKVAEYTVATPGKAAKIELTADISGKEINKDKPDTVFIYAKITDEKGTVLHNAATAVTFELEGENAELIGQNPMPAEAGIAAIVLRTEKLNKPITIKASVQGMSQAVLEIK
jgi:beta-galactosidase